MPSAPIPATLWLRQLSTFQVPTLLRASHIMNCKRTSKHIFCVLWHPGLDMILDSRLIPLYKGDITCLPGSSCLSWYIKCLPRCTWYIFHIKTGDKPVFLVGSMIGCLFFISTWLYLIIYGL